MVLQTVIAVLVMGGLVALPSWALHRAARWGLRHGFQLNVGPLATALPSVGVPDWLHKVVEIAKDVWWLWLLLVAIVGYVLHRRLWPAPEAG